MASWPLGLHLPNLCVYPGHGCLTSAPPLGGLNTEEKMHTQDDGAVQASTLPWVLVGKVEDGTRVTNRPMLSRGQTNAHSEAGVKEEPAA